MQGCQVRVGARIAADQVQGGHRYVEFVATGVFHGDEFSGLVIDIQGFQALVATDPVIDMHYRHPGAQFVDVFVDVGNIGATVFPASPLGDPVTKELGFTEQGGLTRSGVKATVDGSRGDAQRNTRVDKNIPGFAGKGFQVNLRQ